MLPSLLLVLLALFKTSIAKLLLTALIIAIAIIHEMIMISIDEDRPTDNPKPSVWLSVPPSTFASHTSFQHSRPVYSRLGQ
ncbi:hypothetical protein BJX61DRAFT_510005 [Aspergillus egyptiacus]|nr:hypothetical protein BJX61DRAFT_510005 [Aspergillus egyptiacus]